MNNQPTTATPLLSPVVIWQPYVEGCYAQEPAILVHKDAVNLIVITQEGRDILVQPETVKALVKTLNKMLKEIHRGASGDSHE